MSCVLNTVDAIPNVEFWLSFVTNIPDGGRKNHTKNVFYNRDREFMRMKGVMLIKQPYRTNGSFVLLGTATVEEPVWVCRISFILSMLDHVAFPNGLNMSVNGPISPDDSVQKQSTFTQHALKNFLCHFIVPAIGVIIFTSPAIILIGKAIHQLHVLCTQGYSTTEEFRVRHPVRERDV